MAAYDELKIAELEEPISSLPTIPSLGEEEMKQAFDKTALQIMAAFNAALDVLGAHRDAYEEWKAQLEALDIDAGSVASLSAAIVALQNAQAETSADVADRELKTLVFQNQSVATTGWATYAASGSEETALYADGYIYRKSLAMTGVLESMRIVESAMSNSALKCGTTIWTNALTYDGGIKIYAKGVPTSAFTILSISFGRA